jgi:hypothetical protein
METNSFDSEINSPVIEMFLTDRVNSIGEGLAVTQDSKSSRTVVNPSDEVKPHILDSPDTPSLLDSLPIEPCPESYISVQPTPEPALDSRISLELCVWDVPTDSSPLNSCLEDSSSVLPPQETIADTRLSLGHCVQEISFDNSLFKLIAATFDEHSQLSDRL